MDAARLAVWTAIGVNRSVFQPTHRQILERYPLNFSKGGKVHEDDLGLLDDAGDGSDAVADVVTEDGSYFARYGEPPPTGLRSVVVANMKALALVRALCRAEM